jgi:ATP-dependent DNA helicase RecG
MKTFIDRLIQDLREMIASGEFRSLETEMVEVKPLPSTRSDWRQIQISANAFMNTRGGILLLGVKEERLETPNIQKGIRYRITGYDDSHEPNIKELRNKFCDRNGNSLDLSRLFPEIRIETVGGERVALVFVDALVADEKYAYLEGQAYKRVMTGDHKINEEEIQSQEEYKDEAANAREIKPCANTTIENLSLDRLNEFILYLNRPAKLESIKPTLSDAQSFLQRKNFIVDGRCTTLGLLVCGIHPEQFLGYRCDVHGYVVSGLKGQVASDKRDMRDNVLPLMEDAFNFVWRNIQVGITTEQGGKAAPEYPENVIRETINNALAHRDYSLDRQVVVTISPGVSVQIANPGRFRKAYIYRSDAENTRIRRIFPDSKATNPKLADLLRVYSKWEGQGIGMATLVNLALENQIDVPYYELKGDEVRLTL